MANRKISDLTALTTPASGDYLPIVDISEAADANKNKRITIEELMRGAPNGTAAAPGIAFEGSGNGIYSPGADQIAFGTGGSERLRITSDGKVGLGSSTAPGGSDARMWIDQAGTNDYGLLINASGGVKQPTLWLRDASATLSGKIVGQSGLTLATGSSATAALTIDSSQRVGCGTTNPTALLDVSSNVLRLRTAKTPASATDTGNAGDICWDANYVYVCTATNTWKRSALSTW